MSQHPLDQLDVDLQDDELLEEVELTAALMVAANQSESLTLAEIDALLGVTRPAVTSVPREERETRIA